MNVTVNIPQDRASQINFALVLYSFSGQPWPELCESCGGIKDEAQSETRRCLCSREEPNHEHANTKIHIASS